MVIKDIFFDLDRTLWDFEKNSESTLKVLYEEFKLSNYIATFQEFYIQYKLINKKFWSDYSNGIISKEELQKGRFTYTLKEFNIENESLGFQMNNEYVRLSPFQTHLFPNATEILKELKEMEYHLHIITNGFLEVQHLKLKNSGLTNFFDSVLCSEEVGENKPHPRVFRDALERAKARADRSIMIGDDFNADVLGAEGVGIHGILFDPNGNFKKNPSIDRVENLAEIPRIVLGL